MDLDQRLANVERLFLDTSPVVYFVEENERYLHMVDRVFERIDAGTLPAATSAITLVECLVMPIRRGQAGLQDDFIELMTANPNLRFLPIDQDIAQRAAQLRARYRVALGDALQLGAALSAGCDAFLTNDIRLKHVSDIAIIVLDDLAARA